MNRMHLRRRLRGRILILTSLSSILAITFAAIVAGAFALRSLEKPGVLRVAAGPPGSADAEFAEAIQRISKDIGVKRVEVLKTEDPSAAASALDERRAEVAITRSDVAMPRHGGTMLIVHKDVVMLIAASEAKIGGISDLKEKRVGIVPGTSANVTLLDAILAHAGVPPSSVQHISLQPAQVMEAIDNKLVDVMFVVTPLGDPLAAQVVSVLSHAGQTPIEFIEIKNAAALARRQLGLEKAEIPAGFFQGSPPRPAADVSTVAIIHHLVARHDLSDTKVTALTKGLFAMRTLLADQSRVAEYMEAADTEKGSRYPLHSGAAAYYGDNEESFMDRYGDWIYILAIGFGGLASAVATLISSVRARARRAAMAVVDELIGFRRKAVEAHNLADLDKYETAVEEVAVRAVHLARDNRFDETGLEAVRLAVDEARHAIVKRERELEASQGSHRPSP